MNKLWKYIVGFFTILGGILMAFLSGKGAGRKEEKIKGHLIIETSEFFARALLP